MVLNCSNLTPQPARIRPQLRRLAWPARVAQQRRQRVRRAAVRPPPFLHRQPTCGRQWNIRVRNQGPGIPSKALRATLAAGGAPQLRQGPGGNIARHLPLPESLTLSYCMAGCAEGCAREREGYFPPGGGRAGARTSTASRASLANLATGRKVIITHPCIFSVHNH